MRCWNCNRKLGKKAKVCKYCEAPVQAGLEPDEIKAVQEMLQQMPPEVFEELAEVMEQSATAEEFVNRLFVGNCPKCDSADTGHCENDPEINHPLVGRCYACGQLFCTECQRLLSPTELVCPCWDEEISDQ